MFTTPEGYAAAAFVFVVSLFVLRWTNRHQQDWLDECQEQLDEHRRLLWVERRRVDLLADACRRGGIDIPAEVWERPDVA